jgi:XTP/dITP diphosphohydrolase
MTKRTIVLASTNKKKLVELNTLLEPAGLTVVGLDAFPDLPEVEETGATFEENALLKACQTARATGFTAVADDSGLAVDALAGAPGVYSARYSAEDSDIAGTTRDERNLNKLLIALRGVPEAKRTARFVCVMAACTPEGNHLVRRGEWEGRIAEAPAGHNGFGYDPIFFDPEVGCTAAQMPAERKNSRSHRGKAVRSFLEAFAGFAEV